MSFVLFGISILTISLLLLTRHAQVVIESSVAQSIQFQQARVDAVARFFTESGSSSVVRLADSMEAHRYMLDQNLDDLKVISRWMESIVSASMDHYRVEMYDTQGKVILSYFSSPQKFIRQDQTSVGMVRLSSKVLQENVFNRYFPIVPASQYHFSDHPNIKVMLVLAPIFKDGYGHIAGYVGLYVNVDLLLKVMTTNNTLDLFVADKNNNLIDASIPNANAIWLHLINNPQANDYVAKERRLVRYPIEGINNGQGLVLYSRAAKSFLVERENEIRQDIVNIAFVVFVFSIVFGLLLAVSPSRVVTRLHRVSKERNQYLKIMDQYVPVLETDLHGVITNCNNAFAIISGYPKGQLVGQRASVLSFSSDRAQSQDMWDTLTRRLPWQGEFHNVTLDGREFWLFSTVIPIYHDGKVTGYMSVSTDKTEKKRLELLAEMDSLTKLYNRAKLDKCLAQEQSRARRYGTYFSIILLDVDLFKQVNDTYGHLIGDKVLHQLAIMLNHSTRITDEVGRWGGEEFMIVCPETDLEQAEIVAEKVRKAVEEYEFPEAGNITVSLGVAMYEAPLDLQRTIAEADCYLYEAKKLGRNRVASRLSKVTSLKTVGKARS